MSEDMEDEQMEDLNVNNSAEAREKIQEIIEELQNEQPSLIDPKNLNIDQKMRMLDQIFTQYCHVDNNNSEENGSEEAGKAVNVSQARLDIEAFKLIASINHQRIRAVQSASWTFRASDFASRIVSVLNSVEGSPSENMTSAGRQKLYAMINPYVNSCVPLSPLLGCITLTETETAPKERRQRQPKVREEKQVQVKQNPIRLADVEDEDQNTQVVKHVEYILKILKKEYKKSNGRPISYFSFVVDPVHFHNTVENIFYVSYLIKDGFVALEEENNVPVLIVTDREMDRDLNMTQSQQSAVAKKQLIIGMDYAFWKQLVSVLRLERAKIDPEAKDRHIKKRARHE